MHGFWPCRTRIGRVEADGVRRRGLLAAAIAAAVSLGGVGAAAIAGHLFSPGGTTQSRGETFLAPQPGQQAAGASGTSLASSSPVVAARACPDEVLRELSAADTAGATLAVAYETATFRIDICRLAGDRLTYHGVAKRDSTQTITLPAVPIRDGYRATNSGSSGVYTYEITSQRLDVRHDGVLLRAEPVTAQQ